MCRLVTLFLFSLIIGSFAIQASSPKNLEFIVADYYSTYSERKNFKKFMSFYAENAVVDDLVYGHLASGKNEIKVFFNWSHGDYNVINNQAALTISDQTINKSTVVTRGIFNQFKYMGKTLGPWRFIMWHEFNKEGKIIYQEDWINYTPKKEYLSGQNRNAK